MSSHRSPKTKMPAYDAAKHRAFKDKARGIDCDSESEFSDSDFMISSKDEPKMSTGAAARRRAFKDKARDIESESDSELSDFEDLSASESELSDSENETKKETEMKKRDAELEVKRHMVLLVTCLWVHSTEYRERSKKDKSMAPSLKNRNRLIKKAAKILIKVFKHDRDIMGFPEENVNHHLSFVKMLVDEPALYGLWEGIDYYPDVNADSEVFHKMSLLVSCSWVHSTEYNARSKKYRDIEPSPKNRIRLIEKAAKILMNVYKHDRDVLDACADCTKIQLISVQKYADTEFQDFWDGMGFYGALKESEEAESKNETKRECTKPKYMNIPDQCWLLRD